MQQIDKIRARCLQKMDNHYSARIEYLVDNQRLDDAESLVFEMTVDDEEFLYDDLFLDDLTEWTETELENIVFQDIDDIEVSE